MGIGMSMKMDMDLDLQMSMEDAILFQKESPSKISSGEDCWKIMIVDDEEDVHVVTLMVMDQYTFEGRNLSFLHAYSAEQAKEILALNPDIAVVFLDLVMESDRSGLELVHYIRNTLRNNLVRIVIRTGHSIVAPAMEVITSYDVNDYREKAELTASCLYSATIAALRSYRDMLGMEFTRKSLEQIISASGGIFQFQSLKRFAEGVVSQLVSVLHSRGSAVFIQVSGQAATSDNIRILAGAGQFMGYLNCPELAVPPSDILDHLNIAMRQGKNLFINTSYIGLFSVNQNRTSFLYYKGYSELSPMDRDILRIYSNTVSVAFENLYLHQEVYDTQKELIFILGEVVEWRSIETASHVRRVSAFSYHLASKYGLGDEEADLIQLISPMHDIGKISIPDAILLKQGKLTDTEYQIIKCHTQTGYRILNRFGNPLMEMASVVALQHHERWDGLGYPQGLKGDETHLYARIVALADVFDAISNRRSYKEAWPREQVLSYISNERGGQFDPELVDLFLANADFFFMINDLYPDKELYPIEELPN